MSRARIDGRLRECSGNFSATAGGGTDFPSMRDHFPKIAMTRYVINPRYRAYFAYWRSGANILSRGGEGAAGGEGERHVERAT